MGFMASLDEKFMKKSISMTLKTKEESGISTNAISIVSKIIGCFRFYDVIKISTENCPTFFEKMIFEKYKCTKF